MRTTKLFVYGTLRRGCGNHRLLDGSEYHGIAVLDGYRMVSLGGFPAIYRGEKGDTVTGEVYEVDAATLRRLDSLEGFNRQTPTMHDLYHAVPVTVDGEQQHQCETYTMDHSLRELEAYDPVSDGDWRRYADAQPRYVYGE